MNDDDVTVQIRYKDVEKTFSGSLEEVWISLNKFFGEFVPAFEIARKLALNVDLQKLVGQCEGVIAFSPEGPNLMISRSKLTDNETLCLWLLANYIGYRLGTLKNETMSKEELQAKLGKDAKITSTRLGELVKGDTVMKTADERFRITTLGIIQMQKDYLPKIRSEMAK